MSIVCMPCVFKKKKRCGRHECFHYLLVHFIILIWKLVEEYQDRVGKRGWPPCESFFSGGRVLFLLTPDSWGGEKVVIML